MKPLRCLLGRHRWHSTFDHEHKRVHWRCARCGADKIKMIDSDVMPADTSGGPPSISF